MTNVVIVVEDGRVTEVYSRNKNIQVEVLDLDVWNCNEEEHKKTKKRLGEVEKAKSYKNILD